MLVDMHYRQGIQFYVNFQEILVQFKHKCEEFVFSRNTEKQDLLTYGFVVSLWSSF